MKPKHLFPLFFTLFLTACVGRRVTVGPMPLPATPTVAMTAAAAATITPPPIATASIAPTPIATVTEPVAATPTLTSIPFPTLTPDTPLWPTAYSSLQVVDRAGGPLHHVVVQEPYAYILGVQEILVVDVSVPATPQLVNRHSLAWGSEPQEMYLAGNRLVVSLAASSESPDCGPEINVYVLDISQPPTITPFAEETSCFILDTALAADHLYTLLMGHASTPPRLAIFDLAAGGDWMPVNEAALPEWQTESGLIAGAILAAADDQLILAQTTYGGAIQRLAEYTLSEPATPQLVSLYKEGAIPEALQTLLLAAGGRTDIDSLPDCCSAWEWPQSAAHNLDMYQGITYVLAEEGLQLWQKQGEAVFQQLNRYPELAGMMMLPLGEYVMLAGPNAAANHLTFHLYQRTNPAQPQFVTSSELRYRGDWGDWVQEGTRLYAAATNGIQIINLEDLASPIETAFLTTYPGVQALAVHNETLILLWWNRLELVQETTPGEWTTIYTMPVADPAFLFEIPGVAASALGDVAVVGDRLFVLSQWGVALFDLSDPSLPTLIKQKPLNVDRGRLFPAGEGGVLIAGEEVVLGYEHLIGLDANGESLWYERWSDERTIEDMVLGADGLLYAATGEDGLVVLQPIAP